MALEDMIRSAAPGGNFGKPLMLALLALLVSGTLFRGGGAGQPASTGAQQEPSQGAGGLLSGLGGLLTKLQQAGLGNVANSWLGPGQNQPVSPGQLGSALGPDVIKALVQRSGLSEEEVTTQLSQVLPRGGRQIDAEWTLADSRRTFANAVIEVRTFSAFRVSYAVCFG
jgi:uncharacterized protein YidB (DUF937 family)